MVTEIAEEVPVALAYNGVSHAVMMATPADLEDFALGFSLAEGILRQPWELLDAEVREQPGGLVVDMTVTQERAAQLREHRRTLVGRTGCGLCGVESLDQAMRPVPKVGGTWPLSRAAIAGALAELPLLQALKQRGHAVHAAGWAERDGRLSLVREDVGRHNALDKLIGAMAAARLDPTDGFAVITSRCSYEMAQKAATHGIGLLVAMAAPTRLALDVAQASGLALVAWARGVEGTVCTHPARIAA